MLSDGQLSLTLAQMVDQRRDGLRVLWLSAAHGEFAGLRALWRAAAASGPVVLCTCFFQACVTCFHRSSYEPMLRITTSAASILPVCGACALMRCRASSRLILRLRVRRSICTTCGRVRYPDAVTRLAQVAFEQLDRFDHNHRLAGAPHQHVDCFPHQWMNDLFELAHGASDRERPGCPACCG